MPYKLRGNCVVKSDSGETVKCHESHDKAVAHLRALYANVPDAKEADSKSGDGHLFRADELREIARQEMQSETGKRFITEDELREWAKNKLDAIYEQQESETKEADATPSGNNLHGPGGILSMPGQTGGTSKKKKKKVVSTMIMPKEFAAKFNLSEKDFAYAAEEGWHVQSLMAAMSILAGLMHDEAEGGETDNVNTLSDIMDDLMEYAEEQKGELVSAMSDDSETTTKELGGYLVTEDDGTKHLPTRVNGKLDPRHLAAARAALTSNYRGHSYQGPNKSSALSKLKRLYSEAGLQWDEKESDLDSQFLTTKEGDKYRWTLITGSAFEDRDGEIIMEKAFTRDCDEMELTGDYGELLWWHCDGDVHGTEKEARPYIPLGSCDTSLVFEKLNIESGLYYENEIGRLFSEKASAFGASKSFFHLPDEPREGVYSYIRTKERSIMPRGKESNLLTRLFGKSIGSHKEKEMADNKERLAALKEVLGDENFDKLTEVAQKASQRAEQFLASKEAKKKGKPESEETPADEPDDDTDDMPMKKKEFEEVLTAQKEYQDRLELTIKEFTEKTAQRLDAIETNVAQMEKSFAVLMGVQPKAAQKELRASQAESTVTTKETMTPEQKKLAEQSEKAQADVRQGIESYADWLIRGGQEQYPVR